MVREVPPRAIPPPGGVLRQARSENFVVASRVLPRNVRDHLLAIYGFARLVDDIGDEVPGDRLALLAWVDGELDAIDAGATPADPILRRVTRTIRALDLPSEPFRRLIEANRQDQVVTRYETSEDLVSYCELSANPVGRLVLRVFGVATPERDRLSDAICTGLQLTEHWQDIAEDFSNGRVYLPQEDLRRFGCSEVDLAARSASPALRRLVAFEVDRARSLLVRGSPLVREMHGRARVALAGFVGGGHAALDAIEGANHDVLAHRPTPSRTRRLGRTLAELVPLTERGRP